MSPTGRSTKEIQPRLSREPKSPASAQGCPLATLPQLFKEAVAEKGGMPALMVERPLPQMDGKTVPPPLPLTKWKTWTFQEYYDECRTVARAMMALGLEPWDGVTIFGFNSPEWLIGEIAGIMAGGVAAGIYPSDMPDQVVFNAKHTAATLTLSPKPQTLNRWSSRRSTLARQLPWWKTRNSSRCTKSLRFIRTTSISLPNPKP